MTRITIGGSTLELVSSDTTFLQEVPYILRTLCEIVLFGGRGVEREEEEGEGGRFVRR